MTAQNYAVLLGGVSLAQGSVRPDRLLAIDAGDVRQGHGLTGEATRDPSFDCPALWIEPRERDHAIAEGFLTVDPSTVIATHANQVLLAQAQELLGPEEVRKLLDALKESAPSLVETVHPEPLSLAAMTRIFRALIADGIGLGHPQSVLTSLALALQRTQEFDALIDAVRSDMGAKLIGRICEPGARLKVATLDANLEAAILGSVPDPATGQPMIEPECGTMIVETLNTILAAEEGAIALIVQPPARRPVANLLRQRVPRCLVLSINELPATQPVEVVSVIGAEETPGELPPVSPDPIETSGDAPGALAA
ncbi:MAG: FHIPEP family type III secretion protein [Pseudomonadota bacterium]